MTICGRPAASSTGKSYRCTSYVPQPPWGTNGDAIPKGVDDSWYNKGSRQTARSGVSPSVYKYSDETTEALPQERPRLHTRPNQPLNQKESRCGAIVARAWDTDIAPAAVEWRDTRYRNRHRAPGPAHRPSRKLPTGNTGSLTYVLDSLRRVAGRLEVLPRGRAEPERYPGRVARLIHNGVLASNSSPGPHSGFFSHVSSSRDEWVGPRGVFKECGRDG